MRAAPRDEFAKGNEWKIYDYVTRHFIATLHDDMTYTERTVLIDIAGHRLGFLYNLTKNLYICIQIKTIFY